MVLDVQLTQEAAFFRGKFAGKNGGEGDFHPGRFKSLIPLPYPVHPDTILAAFEDDILRMLLLKQAAITQAKFRLNLVLLSASISRHDEELIGSKNSILKQQFYENFRNNQNVY